MTEPVPRHRLRTWLTWIGGLLSVGGLVFVVQRIVVYAGQIDLASLSPLGCGTLLLLAVIYGTANCLLAAGWWQLLRRLKAPARFVWAVRAYAISQLAKYVPGNVFQFVGRQALGVAAGFGNGPLLKSTVLELLILAGAGAVFAPLVVPRLATVWTALDFVPVMPAWVWGGAFILAVTLGLWLLRYFGGPQMLRAGLCYGIFVAISGVVFAGCLAVAGGSASWPVLGSLIGAYVVAWLVGLLTPGAPAGLGMREAVLLVLLSGTASEPVILLAILLGRAVTVLGDVGFCVAGTLTRRAPTDAQEAPP